MTTETPHSNDPQWTLLDIDGLVDAYREHIEPDLRADGYVPEVEQPTYSWLRENGYRQFIYTLREHHDRTVAEFWTDDLGYSDPGTNEGYDWASTDDATVDALKHFLEKHPERNDEITADSTVQTYQYRLNRYVRAYRDANGHSDLLSPIAPDSDQTDGDAIDECLAAFDRLNNDLDGARTKQRIREIASEFYTSLVRRRRARLNPVDVAGGAFSWNADDLNPSALSTEHIRSLMAAANTLSEQLIIIGLAGWGLRPGEVASLRASELVLNPDDDDVPYLEFDDRKNGPGTVAMLVGQDTLNARLDELADDSWNGYLFPSTASGSGHISRQTLLNRFHDLRDRAGLPAEIDGQRTVPKMGRRFWYSTYSGARDAVLESLEDVAEEQGSASPDVVYWNYLSEERRRKLRREQMRDRLADAFESVEA